MNSTTYLIAAVVGNKPLEIELSTYKVRLSDILVDVRLYRYDVDEEEAYYLT